MSVVWSGELTVRRVDDKYRLGDRLRAPGYQALCAGRSNGWRWTVYSRPKEKCFCMLGPDSSWVGQGKKVRMGERVLIRNGAFGALFVAWLRACHSQASSQCSTPFSREP
jgi:hypothetical protein